MLLSIFDSLHAQTCKTVEIEWSALCSYLAAPPEYPTKDALPLLKLAQFGEARSAKGALRNDANTLAVSGVEGDHDAETMTPEEAWQRLQGAGIQALIYTSASNRPGKPRWRVLAPTSQPYAPAARRELAGRLNGVLAGACSPESFALSQGFYFGRVTGAPYVAYATQGQPLDLVPNLSPVFPSAGTSADVGDYGLTAEPVPEWRGPVDDDDLLRRALQSRSAASAFGMRASFADLWECNTEVLAKVFPDSANPFNASEADAALVAHLAFWTGKHGERIQSIMQRSKLARDKWQRDDYLPRTIARVCGAPGDVCTDKEIEPLAAVVQATGEAPTQTTVGGQTFLSAGAQRDLFRGCVYVQHGHKVVVPGGHLMKPDVFRVTFGGYVFAMDTVNERTSRDAWEAFTQSQALRAPIVETTCFQPDRPPGEITSDAGRRRVNLWWPAEIKRTPGNVEPFLHLVRTLLPDERDQQIMLSYMAACVQHKGHKFGWAPVLQGAEGNGKSTLSACVAQAVGQRYTHWPHATDLASDFNGWVEGKVLIAVEELYDQEHQSEVVEKLKTLITGGMGMQIQYKGVDQESREIVANFMATTNYKAAVRKTADNMRRLAVFYSAQQSYADIVRDGLGGDYFPRLYHWLRQGQGFAIVSELLHTYPIDPAFDPSGAMHRAPNTSSTDAAIIESRGGIEQQVAEAIAQDSPGFMGGWVSTIMLDRLLNETLRVGGKLSLAKRREMLQAMGYVLHPGLADGRVNNPVQPDGRKPQLFIRADHPSAHIRGPADIARAYSMAQTMSIRTP